MQLEQLNMWWNDLHVPVYSFRLFYVRILFVDIFFCYPLGIPKRKAAMPPLGSKGFWEQTIPYNRKKSQELH